MKKLGFVVLVLLNLICINKAKSNHLAGSDLTWSCVGQDSFLVKLVVYRDCNGVALSASPITFKCATTGATIATLTIGVGSPVDITPTCNSSCTRCSSPSCSFPYGIQQYIMQGIVNLSGAGSCCSVKLSWEQSARSAIITTGAANMNFFIQATLNRCQSPCDNSPTFSNPPIAILCIGQPFTYNHGAHDVDVNNTGGLADSLTYEWGKPLWAADSPISYLSPYSYNKPINFYGFPNDALPWPRGIHLDPQSGDVQFQPMKPEVTVMVIKINEYRNGVKIAEIRRDLQIIVITCLNNNPPSITTPNNVRSKSNCAGDLVTFNFSTGDPNANDTVTISWDNALKGATWTNTNGLAKHPSGTLTWTPTDSNVSSLPYTFTVTARDNACPIRGSFTQAYQIIVKPKPRANLIVTDSGCGLFWFKAQPIAGTGPVYTWMGNSFIFSPSIGPSTSHTFLPGKYPYSMTMYASGCSNTYFDTVVVDSFISIKLPPDTTVCSGTQLQINSQVHHFRGPVSYLWNTSSLDTLSFKTITITKDTMLIINAFDSTTCKSTDTIRISIRKSIGLDLDPVMRICSYETANITSNNVIDIVAMKSIIWTDLKTNTVVGNSTILSTSDSGRYMCAVTDTIGCTYKDTIQLVKSPEVIASVIGQTICYGKQAELDADATGGGNAQYKWYEGTKLIGTTKKIKVNPTITTDYQLKVSETINGVTCKDSTMVRVRVNPLPVIKINPIDKRCVNGTIISLNGFVTVDSIFKPGGIWSTPSTGLVYADKFNPVAAGVSSYPGWMVRYEYTDPTTGCYNKDSDYVTIFALPKPFAGNDISICTGSKIPLIGSPLLPPGIWLGKGVGGSYPNWRFNPDTTGINIGGKNEAIYRYIDNNQCENDDTVIFTVFSTPVVDAGNPKEFCINSNSFALTGNPAGGTWSGTGVTSNVFYPSTVTPGIHDLTYTYTNMICTGSDKVAYTVYPKPQTPVISISPTDSFLECNYTNGSYEWYYRPNKFAASSPIVNNFWRINPKLYCKKGFFSVVYIDPFGCESDTSALYNYGVNSIYQSSRSSGFNFYPNPAHSELFIENPGTETASMMLSDIYGKTLLEKNIKPGKSAITIQNYKPGIYFIFMNGMIAGKLLIE